MPPDPIPAPPPTIPLVYIKFFMGLILAAVIALVVWVWNADRSVTTLRSDLGHFQETIELSMTTFHMSIEEDIKELKEDTGNDAKQDSQISKHWRLHSWARGRINNLETKAGEPLSEWPDLPVN